MRKFLLITLCLFLLSNPAFTDERWLKMPDGSYLDKETFFVKDNRYLYLCLKDINDGKKHMSILETTVPISHIHTYIIFDCQNHADSLQRMTIYGVNGNIVQDIRYKKEFKPLSYGSSLDEITKLLCKYKIKH